jgi:hypothetical protein
MIYIRQIEGGPTSGNFGHAGRKGLVGGSASTIVGFPEMGSDLSAYDTIYKMNGIIKNDAGSCLIVEDFKYPDKQHEALQLIAETHVKIAESFPGIKAILEKEPVRYLYLRGRNVLFDTDAPDRTNLWGTYEYNYDKINVSTCRGVKDAAPRLGDTNVSSNMAGCYRHELGHHVYRHMNPEVKVIYTNIIRGMTDKQIRSGISYYAATKITKKDPLIFRFRETFAESFSAYTNPAYGSGKKLPKDIHAFFEKTFPKK